MSIYQFVGRASGLRQIAGGELGSFSLDGMGGNDSFYGVNGVEIFTDLVGDNSASDFGGIDTLKLCNHHAIFDERDPGRTPPCDCTFAC